jgi:16S rRNA (guanine527-N7)-methyltransferase
MVNQSKALRPEFAALDHELAAGLEAMGLDLSSAQRHRLLAYLELLKHWSRAFNLTAVVEPREMVARHLLDSLSLLPWITGRSIVDSGTGAGLPGVPLAIALPDRRFTLIDGNGKKIRFLRQVRRSLDLPTIEPVQARLEALPERSAPDQITARALAPLPRLVEWHRNWLDQGAQLLAMKSRGVEGELSDLPAVYNVALQELKVPGETAHRCLAIVTKK